MKKRHIGWLAAEWILLAIWVTAALVTMYPHVGKAIHLYGGFFSSSAADLSFPAWFYIQLRQRQRTLIPWVRWFGASPELAAASIFAVGVISEVCQYYWPKGIFHGTFDPLDIAAYFVSLLACYLAEKLELGTPVLTGKTVA